MSTSDGCFSGECPTEHHAPPNSFANNHALLMLSFAIVVSSIFLRAMRRSKYRPSLPPFAPHGYIETVSNMSGPRAPNFLLNTCRNFGSAVEAFRIRCPMPGATYTVVVSDALLGRSILEDPSTTKTETYKVLENITDVPIMFSRDEDYAKSVRKCMAAAFSPGHVKRINRVCQDKLGDWIANVLSKQLGEPVDINREMVNLTMKTLSEAAFDYDVTNDEIDFFLRELDIAIREFTKKQLVQPWRKVFGFLIPAVWRAKAAASNIMRFSQEVLDSYRSRRNGYNKDTEEDTLVKLIACNEQMESDRVKAAELLTFFVSGHESTSSTIAWILLELARNPHVVQEYRNRIKGLECPTEWANTDYLKNIVREGMRLHPVAPLGSKRSPGKDYFAKVAHDGDLSRVDDKAMKPTKEIVVIKKNSVVFFPLICYHRDSKYFVNPDAFDPTRWENISQNDVKAFMPFAAGRRNCIGRSLASAEVHAVVARLAGEFDFEIEDEGTPDLFMTYKPAGLKLIFHKRQ